MTYAESFVLLALEPDGSNAASPLAGADPSNVVVAALVAELVDAGHLELPKWRIQPTGSDPGHTLLRWMLDDLVELRGKKLSSLEGAVKIDRAMVVDWMVGHGTLGREKEGRRLTRHPVADPVGHAGLLAEVRAAAVGQGPLDPRLTALLALADQASLHRVVAPEREHRKHAKRRMREAGRQAPVVGRVVHALQLIAD